MRRSRWTKRNTAQTAVQSKNTVKAASDISSLSEHELLVTEPSHFLSPLLKFHRSLII